MKLNDLEDADQIPTRDYLDAKLGQFEARIDAKLAELEARILGRMLDMQRSMYQLIFGTYALIVVGVFINHFWK